MRMRLNGRSVKSASRTVLLAVGVGGWAGIASAQSTSAPFVLVPNGLAVGGGTAAISTFGYDPVSNIIYTVPSATNAQIFKISGFDVGQTPMSSINLGATDYGLWLKNGDGNNGGGPAIPGSLLLNPKAIGATPAYSFAMITDGGATFTSGGTPNLSLTQRVYSYNLQHATPGNRGADVLSSVVTQAAMQAVTGAATTAATNLSRQGAWSADGQRYYYYDTSTAYGGIWSYDFVTSSLTRVSTFTNGVFEPAVQLRNGKDNVYVATASGGIGRISTDGTVAGTSGTVDNVLTNSQLTDFLDIAPGTATAIGSMTFDANGNLIFAVTAPSGANNDRRGMYELDSSGRLSKVFSRQQRIDAFGGTSPNANMQRLHTRTLTGAQLPAGYTQSSSLQQLMYVEFGNTGGQGHLVAAANLYAPGDFDFNGAVNAADRSLFLAQLTNVGTATTNATQRLYDMNGSSSVDWKDVKVLQSFLGFKSGDANLDMAVDYTDLNILRDNYLGTNKNWSTGDFASGTFNSTTYSSTAADANITNLVDVQALADSWLNVLHQPKPTVNQLNAHGYSGQFRTDLISAFAISLTPTWNVDADGNWDVQSNWTTPVPDGAGTAVILGNAISAPHTVMLQENRTVGAITFDSPSPNSYTVAGPGIVQLDATAGNASITVLQGNHIISARVALLDPTTFAIADGSTLSVTGPMIGLSGITVTGGTLTIGTYAAGPLAITGSGHVGITIGGVVTGMTETAVRSLVSAGQLDGVAAAGDPRAPYARLAVADNLVPVGGAAYYSTFFGTPASSSDVLLYYTYTGDTNLDGILDGADLAKVIEGLSTGQTGWSWGDVNYDGVVNGADWMLVLDAFANYSTPFASPAGGNAGGGAVPEPTSLAIAGLGAASLGRRRRTLA